MSEKTPRVRRDERGSTLVEAAFVLPVLLVVLFNIIGFGVDLGLKQSVTHAASEAARDTIGSAGASTGAAACTAWTASATSTVNKALSWLPSSSTPQITINYFDSSNSPITCTGSGTTYLQVVVKVPTILPNFPGFAPTSVTSQAQVQVQ